MLQACAQKASLDYGAMEMCANGTAGEKVDVANAKATLAYTGDWMGTPTVTVNGHTITASGFLGATIVFSAVATRIYLKNKLAKQKMETASKYKPISQSEHVPVIKDDYEEEAPLRRTKSSTKTSSDNSH